MDLEAVTDELYALPPGDFTAARDEQAQAARAAGDRSLAEQILRLRRPTRAAWASNLLVREQPEEAERLLQLGQALRQAHHDLDSEQLRKLSAQQRQLISALARQARQLTTQAGQRISEDTQREVEATLHAVLADPAAGQEWVRGRLAKPFTAPVGFDAVMGAEAAPVPVSPRHGRQGAGKVADLDTARARRREEQERLARAREQADEAERELHIREEELTQAQDEQARAEDRRNQAQRLLADLQLQMEQAEGKQREADDIVRATRERVRERERAVREARRRAKETATQVERVAGRAGHRP